MSVLSDKIIENIKNLKTNEKLDFMLSKLPLDMNKIKNELTFQESRDIAETARYYNSLKNSGSDIKTKISTVKNIQVGNDYI